MERRVITLIALLLFCYLGSRGTGFLPVACSPARANGSPPPQGSYGSYTANFLLTENPVSEGGKCTNGKTTVWIGLMLEQPRG
jgi:hypothetical protein